MSRKSPRTVLSPRTCVFRSPLSRMVLSLRMGIFRSSLSSQGASSSAAINASRGEIDLNAYPEEQVENDQYEIEGAQGNACPKRKEVPNSIRKAVFDALLARASNACLKGHETREVSEALSVHIRTMQRIWDQGKKCLDQGIPLDVSNQSYKRGRKKMTVDVSTLRNIPISKCATIRDLAAHFCVSESKAQSMKRDVQLSVSQIL